MIPNIPLNWLNPSNLDEAQFIQREMAKKVILEDHFSLHSSIGGMDVSNNLYDTNIYASVVILDKGSLKLEEKCAIVQTQQFPYIPGFLGFREAPPLIAAFSQLKKKPDLILIDGHGISHPRRLGIASHIGVLLDIPTIGVAKSILIGNAEGILGNAKGSSIPLIWKGEKIGILLRTKERCNPLIISTGHRISLESAKEIVMQYLTRYKLPEPTRQAHLAANCYRRESRKSHELET